MWSAFQNKLFIRLLLAANAVLMLSLLLAYMAPYISPAVFWPVAFFGLGFPVIVIANLAIALLWLLLRPRYALLSLLMLLAGINPLARQWQWGNNPGDHVQESITVVSFNVHDFSGLHDGVENVSTRKEIFNFLRNSKARIICLQDLPFYFADGSLLLPKLAQDLGIKHFYPESINPGNIHKFSDAGLITSFPIVGHGEVFYEGHSFAIYADIVISNDTIRLYSIHLASTKLTDGKELLTTKGIAESGKRGIPRRSFHIIKRLKSAFIIRAYQSDVLRASIDHSPYPVIVCGDHNDTPLSYALHTIRQGLTDSFVSRGKGFGRTYGESTIPLRIDYIMASPCFSFQDHSTVKNHLSDHLPVIAKIYMKDSRHK